MTRFLKRQNALGVHTGGRCIECAMYSRSRLDYGGMCIKHSIFRKKTVMPEEWHCVAYDSHLIDKTFVLVPRPPDGTRCRDLDGNIKVVGRDV